MEGETEVEKADWKYDEGIQSRKKEMKYIVWV